MYLLLQLATRFINPVHLLLQLCLGTLPCLLGITCLLVQLLDARVLAGNGGRHSCHIIIYCLHSCVHVHLALVDCGLLLHNAGKLFSKFSAHVFEELVSLFEICIHMVLDMYYLFISRLCQLHHLFQLSFILLEHLLSIEHHVHPPQVW